MPPDWRIAFNNGVAILWTTYLSFLCGGPGAGVAAAGAGAHGPAVDTAAVAASAVLSVFPCSKAAGALSHPEVAEAARQVAATEAMLAHWGSKVRVGSEGRGACTAAACAQARVLGRRRHLPRERRPADESSTAVAALDSVARLQ